MSNVSEYTPQRQPNRQTMGFGVHRQTDRPASAIRAGETSMPSAWQNRGIATGDHRYQHGADVRSFADQLLDPVRWCMASGIRMALTGSAALLGLIALLT